jgi:hypothetical protein
VIILISVAASIHAFSRLFDGWPFLAVHAWSIGILLFFAGPEKRYIRLLIRWTIVLLAGIATMFPERRQLFFFHACVLCSLSLIRLAGIFLENS